MDNTPDTHEPPDAPDAPEESVEAAPQDAPAPSAASGQSRVWRVLAVTAIVAGVVLLGASQVFLITSQNASNSQIQSLDRQIEDLNSSVGDMSDQVDDIAVAAATASGSTADGATPAPAVPDGYLPQFSNQGPDQAVGLKLTVVEGPDAYSDSALTIDPADGTKRVWMVWAHWCPYCQQELPDLNAWWPEASSRFPNAELVTVTTSMDPSRGNALEPYLESSQFVFPVVVDTNTRIAAQFGVNAFPFWMVTDGDGTVLFRSAGALGMDRVEQLFVQLEEFDA